MKLEEKIFISPSHAKTKQGELRVFCALILLQREMGLVFLSLLAANPGPTWNTEEKFPFSCSASAAFPTILAAGIEKGLGLYGAQRASELEICFKESYKVLEKLVHTVFNQRMRSLLVCRAQPRGQGWFGVSGALSPLCGWCCVCQPQICLFGFAF